MSKPLTTPDERLALFQKWFCDAIPHNKALGLKVLSAGKGVAANFQPGGDYKAIIAQSRAGRQQSQALNNTLNYDDSIKVINDAAALEQFGELMASKEEITKAKIELGDGTEGPSVTYRLRAKLSLPSRADEQVLELTRFELTPDYFYKAVPVLTPHVYRQANLTNTSDYVLLPGEATMYLGTDFVGRAQLPSTVLGLFVHAAEHTQRHVGQLLVTVRVL